MLGAITHRQRIVYRRGDFAQEWHVFPLVYDHGQLALRRGIECNLTPLSSGLRNAVPDATAYH